VPTQESGPSLLGVAKAGHLLAVQQLLMHMTQLDECTDQVRRLLKLLRSQHLTRTYANYTPLAAARVCLAVPSLTAIRTNALRHHACWHRSLSLSLEGSASRAGASSIVPAGA
jgi:hypothetical protein